MKKTITLLMVCMFMIFGQHTFAQDSTKTNSIVSADKFSSELTLASRNVFRGVSYGESPSIMMKGVWTPCKYFEFGVYGNMTMNGTKDGYGNQINSYVTIKPFAGATNEVFRRISITSDDYYYFNSEDSTNDFFAWSDKKTQHFMEARFKYDGRFDLIMAYTYWAHKDAKVDGIYFEGGYDVSDALYVFAGYISDQSDLMFQSKSGWTNVGFTITRKLHMKEWSPVLKTSLIASPTSKTVYNLPGVGRNPVSLVASITF